MSSEVLKSKYPIAMGGFFGFTIAVFIGYFVGNDIMTILSNASVSCVVCAFLMRFFLRLLDANVSLVRKQKQKAANQEQEVEKKPN